MRSSLVRAVTEILGVAKEDISFTCTGIVLSIRVNSPSKSFEKDPALPYEINVDSARAEYNNRLLGVAFDKVSLSVRGKTISSTKISSNMLSIHQNLRLIA